MAELQASGIPAGAVMNGPDRLDDAQIASFGGLLLQDRPGLGSNHATKPYTRSQPLA